MEKELKMSLMCSNIKLDERTQEYILKRVQKINRFTGKISSSQAKVEIDMYKKGKFRVEIMVKTPFELYRAEEISESVEGSCDVAVNNLIRQITCDKNKMKELGERGARSIKKQIVLSESARFRK